MNEMYKRVESLCISKGINITQMCKETDIPRGNLTDLKNGRTSELSTKTLTKISLYFDVSMEYLLGLVDNATPQTKKEPALTDKDRLDIAKRVEDIMDDLENSGDLQFDGDPMSDEARESMRAAMQVGLEMVKLKNRERFTPKKYRKE